MIDTFPFKDNDLALYDIRVTIVEIINVHSDDNIREEETKEYEPSCIEVDIITFDSDDDFQV